MARSKVPEPRTPELFELTAQRTASSRPKTSGRSGMACLESWLASRAGARRDPLHEASAAPYVYIWQAWLSYLSNQPSTGPQGLTWDAAQPAHVVQFLASRPNASHRGAEVTVITRRRYWHVLTRVYQHAVFNQWIPRNPALDLTQAERPPVERPLGAALPAAIWNQLPETFATGHSRLALRDRAIFRLLYDLALAPQEVRALRYEHLIMAPPAVADGRPIVVGIQIEGRRADQSRRLGLTPASAGALNDWLLVREHAPGHRPEPGGGHPVFATTHGNPLSITILFIMISKAVKETCERIGEPIPARLGPQVLRNTRLVLRLESGADPDEVAREAGLQDGQALLRLHQARRTPRLT